MDRVVITASDLMTKMLLISISRSPKLIATLFLATVQ